MNKRNWISALLAVMMVISMMACIAVPVAAEEVYDLTQEEAEALPSVTTAHQDDGVQSYKISNWEEFIWAASSERYKKTDETVGYVSTGAMKNASSQTVYGGIAMNPTFIDVARLQTSGAYDYKKVEDPANYDRLYLTCDLDVADYSSESGTGLDAFLADFDAFGYDGYNYETPLIVFDGLNHTITGIKTTASLFGGQFAGVIRNLVFDRCVGDTTVAYGGFMVQSVNETGCIIENVHIRNSTYTSNQQNAGAFFVGLANNNNRRAIFKDCSIVNSHMNLTYVGAVNYTGLFAGLINTPDIASTKRPGATNVVSGAENCVAVGCTITCNSLGTTGGLLFGRIGNKSAQGALVFDNIAVFDCGIITTGDSAGNSAYASAVACSNAVATTLPSNDVGNIYAGNVTLNDAPVPQLIYVTHASAYSSQAGVADANYVTDGTIVVGMQTTGTTYNKNATTASEGADYAILDAIEDMNASASHNDWTFDAAGNLIVKEAGKEATHKVTFTADGNTTTYYTDLNGNIRVKADAAKGFVALAAADYSTLAASDWKSANGEAVNAGADWTKVVVSEDTDYTKVSLPPYTMTLDKDTYVKGDIVTATVSLVAGSNLQGVEVGFNYDENVLTPVADGEGNYAIAANGWLVTDKAESEHMMAVTAAAISGENATEAVDVFSVKFKVTQDLASTASELAVTAVLEYAGGLVGDVMTELDLEAYTTVEIAGAAEIKNNDALDEYYTSLPKASTAIRYDGISAYQIDSVAELIRTNMALKQRDANGSGYDKGPEDLNKDDRLTIWNFEETDTVYLTADLDTTDWEVPDDLATYDEATGVYTPKKIGASTSSANFLYVDNDGTNGEIVTCADKQELFNVLYNGFAWGWQVWANYCVQRFDFDGLGHSIKNYSDNHPFFFGNYVGTISNLTFENADVEPIAGGFSGGKAHASIITCGTNRLNASQLQTGTTEGVVMTNVHIKDSTLTVPDGWNSAGMFMTESNNIERGLYLYNCSLTGSTMKVESDQSACSYSRFGLAVGYRDGWMDIKNCIFEDSHIVFDNATAETANTAKAPSRQTLVIGTWDGQDDDFRYNLDNIAVVNCGLIASNADASAAAILLNSDKFGKDTGEYVNVSNIYASGNTVATAEGAEPVAIPNLIASEVGTNASRVAIDDETILTDAGVTALLDNKGTKTENANTTLEAGLAAAVTELEKTITEAHWRVNDDGSLYLLGQEVIFKSLGEEDMVRYTSRLNEHILYEETANGFVAVDPALFTKLTNNYWYNAEISAPTFEDFIEKGYDWENETYAEDITYVRVPKASESYVGDKVTVYVIDSVPELLKASHNYVVGADGKVNANADRAMDDKDTMYLVSDLDMADWDVSEFAVANNDGTYTTIGKFVDAGDNTSNNYNKYSATAAGIDCANKQEVFAYLYNGFNARDDLYTHMTFNFDGLNHTIKNYTARNPLFTGGAKGIDNFYRNVTFVDATVNTDLYNPDALWNGNPNAVLLNSTEGGNTNGGIYIENIHFYGCDVITATAVEGGGMIAKGCTNGSKNRGIFVDNCAIVDCTMTNTNSVASNCSLVVGYMENLGHIKNVLVKDSVLKIRATGHSNSSYNTGRAVNAFIGGTVRDRYFVDAVENVTVTGCTFLTEDTDPHFGGIMAFGYNTSGTVTNINHIYAADNTWATVNAEGNIVGEENPVETLFYDRADYSAQLMFGDDIIVDDVAYVYENINDDTKNIETNMDDLFDATAAIDAMNDTAATVDWYLDNGNYVPAYAMVGTTGYRLNVGHNDIADVINNAKSGDTVKVCLDQEASTVAIPAGVTVELNGAVLDAIVGGDGYVNDNTDGKGGVTGLGTIGAANAQLPLNDEANGVYRLYNVSVVAGTDSAIDGYDNARKFRVKLNFTNKDAYTLVAAGTSGLTLQAVLASSALDADVTYTFKNVVPYAQAIVDNPTKSYSLVLNVYGVDAVADTDLNITYNAASYGAVKSGATTYAVPAVEA